MHRKYQIHLQHLNLHKSFHQVFQERDLTNKELKSSFPSIASNETAGYDGISFNVLKYNFSSFLKPIKHIFNISITDEIFPGKLKKARITPINKRGDVSILSYYRSMSVVPCVFKTLEYIMYDRIFNYLN